MAAAFAEEFLSMAIRQYLMMDEKITETLFDMQGPLGSFSAKIKLAFGLGIIGTAAYSDLNHVREIRNKFAHFLTISDGHVGIEAVTFKSQEIRDRCSAMRFPEASIKMQLTVKNLPIEMFDAYRDSGPPSEPRSRYMLTTLGLGTVFLAHVRDALAYEIAALKKGVLARIPPITY